MQTRIFASPLFLGFDHLEQLIERAAKSSGESYPPYNIEQISDTKLRITLAVAGFTKEDLEITVEDNQLIIRAAQNNREDDFAKRIFIHRGIATRQFQKAFVLAEGIEIEKAVLEQGLLNIDLVRPYAKTKVRIIEISSPENRPPQEPKLLTTEKKPAKKTK